LHGLIVRLAVVRTPPCTPHACHRDAGAALLSAAAADRFRDLLQALPGSSCRRRLARAGRAPIVARRNFLLTIFAYCFRQRRLSGAPQSWMKPSR